jgi:hypothetical protein
MVKTKRIPQLKPATILYDNDLILVDQENVTKKATFKLFKDYIAAGDGGANSGETTYFPSDGVKTSFKPVPGITSTDATKYLVVVGGVAQQANVSYTVSSAEGGTLQFTEAPPVNNNISIQSFQ